MKLFSSTALSHSFSQHSIAAANAAAMASINRLQESGVKFRRPEDYYAEMCKTDKHMSKVKDKLIHDKKSIVEAEQRRKQRDAKKFGKQVKQTRRAVLFFVFLCDIFSMCFMLLLDPAR